MHNIRGDLIISVHSAARAGAAPFRKKPPYMAGWLYRMCSRPKVLPGTCTIIEGLHWPTDAFSLPSHTSIHTARALTISVLIDLCGVWMVGRRVCVRHARFLGLETGRIESRPHHATGSTRPAYRLPTQIKRILSPKKEPRYLPKNVSGLPKKNPPKLM